MQSRQIRKRRPFRARAAFVTAGETRVEPVAGSGAACYAPVAPVGPG